MFMKNSRVAMVALGAVMASSAFASLTTYNQDFESLAAGNGGALSGDGWKIFANVFDSADNYLYGYGPFGAPNGGAGFSAIATGEAGPNQGQQYINTYSDYNNGDHGNNRKIEANIFQEQIIGAADLGQTFTFGFDYKASSGFGPGGASRTWAFIKVLDPANGFNLVAFPRIETTAASTSTWSENNTINITIDPSWTNNILQFGFMNTATAYEPTGMYYDNVTLSAVPEPASMIALGAGLLALARKRRKA